eukprot:757343-Hanusia_phi.AAC.1
MEKAARSRTASCCWISCTLTQSSLALSYLSTTMTCGTLSCEEAKEIPADAVGRDQLHSQGTRRVDALRKDPLPVLDPIDKSQRAIRHVAGEDGKALVEEAGDVEVEDPIDQAPCSVPCAAHEHPRPVEAPARYRASEEEHTASPEAGDVDVPAVLSDDDVCEAHQVERVADRRLPPVRQRAGRRVPVKDKDRAGEVAGDVEMATVGRHDERGRALEPSHLLHFPCREERLRVLRRPVPLPPALGNEEGAILAPAAGGGASHTARQGLAVDARAGDCDVEGQEDTWWLILARASLELPVEGRQRDRVPCQQARALCPADGHLQERIVVEALGCLAGLSHEEEEVAGVGRRKEAQAPGSAGGDLLEELEGRFARQVGGDFEQQRGGSALLRKRQEPPAGEFEVGDVTGTRRLELVVQLVLQRAVAAEEEPVHLTHRRLRNGNEVLEGRRVERVRPWRPQRRARQHVRPSPVEAVGHSQVGLSSRFELSHPRGSSRAERRDVLQVHVGRAGHQLGSAGTYQGETRAVALSEGSQQAVGVPPTHVLEVEALECAGGVAESHAEVDVGGPVVEESVVVLVVPQAAVVVRLLRVQPEHQEGLLRRSVRVERAYERHPAVLANLPWQAGRRELAGVKHDILGCGLKADADDVESDRLAVDRACALPDVDRNLTPLVEAALVDSSWKRRQVHGDRAARGVGGIRRAQELVNGLWIDGEVPVLTQEDFIAEPCPPTEAAGVGSVISVEGSLRAQRQVLVHRACPVVGIFPVQVPALPAVGRRGNAEGGGDTPDGGLGRAGVEASTHPALALHEVVVGAEGDGGARLKQADSLALIERGGGHRTLPQGAVEDSIGEIAEVGVEDLDHDLVDVPRGGKKAVLAVLDHVASVLRVLHERRVVLHLHRSVDPLGLVRRVVVLGHILSRLHVALEPSRPVLLDSQNPLRLTDHPRGLLEVVIHVDVVELHPWHQARLDATLVREWIDKTDPRDPRVPVPSDEDVESDRPVASAKRFVAEGARIELPSDVGLGCGGSYGFRRLDGDDCGVAEAVSLLVHCDGVEGESGDVPDVERGCYAHILDTREANGRPQHLELRDVSLDVVVGEKPLPCCGLLLVWCTRRGDVPCRVSLPSVEDAKLGDGGTTAALIVLQVQPGIEGVVGAVVSRLEERQAVQRAVLLHRVAQGDAATEFVGMEDPRGAVASVGVRDARAGEGGGEEDRGDGVGHGGVVTCRIVYCASFRVPNLHLPLDQ